MNKTLPAIICNAIRPFFTPDMWERFMDAAPETPVEFLAYVKAEWESIYNEFMVTS